MEFIHPNSPKESGQEYFTQYIANNKISRILNGCGYQTIAIESGFYFTDQPIVDLYLAGGSRLTEFEDLLLSDTPIGLLAYQLRLMKQRHSYQAHRDRVLFSLETLGKLAERPGPKFVFAHILSPTHRFYSTRKGRQSNRLEIIQSEMEMISGAAWKNTGMGTPGRLSLSTKILRKRSIEF